MCELNSLETQFIASGFSDGNANCNGGNGCHVSSHGDNGAVQVVVLLVMKVVKVVANKLLSNGSHNIKKWANVIYFIWSIKMHKLNKLETIFISRAGKAYYNGSWVGRQT